MNRIIIAGISISLRKRSKNELQGITVLDKLLFQFYDFEFQGISMLLLGCKEEEKLTPVQLKRYSERLGSLFCQPIVYFFDHLPFYFRKRLIEQGVFFISGEKNAFLPSIIATPSAKKQLPQKLSACAQYLILRHLQEELDRTVSLVEMTKNTPYSYISIAQAVQNLEALNLWEETVGNGQAFFGESCQKTFLLHGAARLSFPRCGNNRSFHGLLFGAGPGTISSGLFQGVCSRAV